jgi:hypothetical protein
LRKKIDENEENDDENDYVNARVTQTDDDD